MTKISLSPSRIGPIEMRNRIIMGSMHMGLEEMKTLDALAAFYAERAKGGAGLIITGGIGPNEEGAVFAGAEVMNSDKMAARHKVVTDAVHAAGGKIAMQILHTGRYAMNPKLVAPSPIKSPITPIAPREMDESDIERTIADFANAAKYAKEAGYDGVEIMGSEGYLINQFLAARTNQRSDTWGGSYGNRMRFAIEIVRAVRAAVGDYFGIIFRISLLDLVEGGSSWDEVIMLAKALEAEKVDALNSGFGWHEARIPTIAASVPPMPFLDYTKALKQEVSLPVIAANRFFEPEQIEAAIETGQTDFVAMARPFLADAYFVSKASNPEAIMPCIACNQACLDHIFFGKRASCLVNPVAGFELELVETPTETPKLIAVIGAGPAGLAATEVLKRRGHSVELFEKSGEIGGQLKLAAKIPGKEDFNRVLDYYANMLRRYQIPLHKKAPEVETLRGFDEIIVATGVVPRKLDIAGAESARAYDDLLINGSDARKIVLIGSGPIGFDVASFLLEEAEQSVQEWRRYWGVTAPGAARAGLGMPEDETPKRDVTMLQRKATRFGKALGKTTGWIHKARLDRAGVKMIGGADYLAIENGVEINTQDGEKHIEADEVVICAGQESEASLFEELEAAGIKAHLIGGARDAAGVDAKRVIREAYTLALKL